MGKITILDVAHSAGVSVATVDRVLNHRTGVRKVTVERVEAAIRQLNYQPDRLAARLARSRDYRFCFVLPTGNNSFMVQLGEEVRAAAERMAPERVVIDMRLTDVFDGNALAATLDQIGDIYDGVAVVALDHPSVREAISGLVAARRHGGHPRLRRAGLEARALCRHRQYLRRAHRGEPDGQVSGRTQGRGRPYRRIIGACAITSSASSASSRSWPMNIRISRSCPCARGATTGSASRR